MSIRTQASADFRSNLVADGDEITLTDQNGKAQIVTGRIVRIDAVEDPQTGQQVTEPRTGISITLADISGDITTDWKAKTTDSTGGEVKGSPVELKFDRTLNFVSFFLDVAK